MTRQKSTMVLEQLWKALLDDPEVVVDGWHGFVLTGEVGTGYAGMSGYAYRVDGTEEAIAPRKSGTLGLLRQLCNAMDEESGKRWKVCLIKLKQNAKASVDFEYTNGDRWKISPATYAERIEQFRSLVMDSSD
jgi:hypothetical protein